MDVVFEGEADTAGMRQRRLEFQLTDDGSEERHIFTKKFQIDRENLSTSFTFQIEFQRSLYNGVVSCTVTLTREDSTKAPVFAILSVHSYFIGNSTPRYEGMVTFPKDGEKMSLSTGDTIKKHIDRVVLFPRVKNCVRYKAKIIVSIIISYKFDKRALIKGANDVFKMPFPKL